MTAIASSSPPVSMQAKLSGILFVALFGYAAARLAALPQIAGLGISPLILGIAAGTLYGNVLGSQMPPSWAAGIGFCARQLLRVAVAFYGLRISFQDVAQIGMAGLVVSTSMVASTLVLGTWVGMKWFKLDRDTALLTAAGGAICGAAAVVAFESTLRSEPHKSAMAIGGVVLFGTLSMFIYPLAYQAGWLHLDVTGAALFFGGTIHEVAQVVGAASGIDTQAVHAATIVKMTRVGLLVPVLLSLSLFTARRSAQALRPATPARARGRLVVPWFAVGFLALVCLNSLHWIPQAATPTANALDTFALTMAMTALGIETRFERIKRAGLRVLGAAAVIYLWLVVGGYLITLATLAWLGR